MRQIEFRGLDSNGVWHYGNLLQSKPFKNGRIDCWIQPKTLLTLGAVSTPTSAFVKVIEKTVGQFIGLKDKAGVDIYEEDIDSHLRVFTYNVEMGGWYLMKNGEGTQWHEQVVKKGRLPFEIIGNTHQNPELSEG